VAEHNIGSAKVLARSGFMDSRSGETSLAFGLDTKVIEHIYRLDK